MTKELTELSESVLLTALAVELHENATRLQPQDMTQSRPVLPHNDRRTQKQGNLFLEAHVLQHGILELHILLVSQ